MRYLKLFLDSGLQWQWPHPELIIPLLRNMIQQTRTDRQGDEGGVDESARILLHRCEG
jgi:hypothetical protein